MLLHQMQEPLGTWEYAERYLGVGTRTYSRYSSDLDITTAYHPQEGKTTFTLPTFWIGPGQGQYLRNGLTSDLGSLYRQGDSFLLPVHPDTLTHPQLHRREQLLGCRRGPDIEVVPSANARTVFVKAIDGVPVPAHFLKLHYPKRISRFTRRLRSPIVGLQLWVSDELGRIAVNYLPEVGAGVFGTELRHAWGYVLRDTAAARDDIPGYTVPLFALYGRDLHAAQDPPLLTQLVKASGQRPVDYLTQRIVEPMIGLWMDSVLRTGCALELHGQNTLFHFSPDNDVTAIGYRDCAVYVDRSIRQELDLATPLPPVNVIGRDILHSREQVFSLTYDSFMGHHALSYIAGLAYREWGTQPRTLQDAARERFLQLSDGCALLPATVYYYDGALHPDGKWNLVDTGATPQWR